MLLDWNDDDHEGEEKTSKGLGVSKGVGGSTGIGGGSE